jgi:acyl-CoA thioesterase
MADETITRARAAAIIAADPFVARLGIRFDEIGEGTARVSVEVADWMVNFHGTTHGGLLFALADAALAAASNSRGQIALALDLSISFMRGTGPGTRLVAEAREIHLGGPTAFYDLEVREEPSRELVARATATAYRKRDTFV